MILAYGTTISAFSWHQWIGAPYEPQIGMNIFQFGAFTQADKLVKAGMAYTAVGVGTVVAAPTAVAAGAAVYASPYVQYNAIQGVTTFVNVYTFGPAKLPSDKTRVGGWLGYAAGLLAWWSEE